MIDTPIIHHHTPIIHYHSVCKCSGKISGVGVGVVAHHAEDVLEDVDFCHHARLLLKVLVGEDEEDSVLGAAVVRYDGEQLVGEEFGVDENEGLAGVEDLEGQVVAAIH